GVVEAFDQLEGAVGGAVVDEDQLVVAARERGGRPPVELLEGAGLVEHGDDARTLRIRSRLIDRNGPGHLAADTIDRRPPGTDPEESVPRGRPALRRPLPV